MADAASVRDLIDRGLALFTLTSFAPAVVATRSIYDAVLREYDDPNATFCLYRMDGTTHDRHLRPDFERVRANDNALNLQLFRGTLGGLVVAVADEVLRANLGSTTIPERQFLRHLRNAVAHGNVFTLSKDEPKHPAAFKGFTIQASMNGMQNVLYDFMGPGDVADLLVHVHQTI